MSQAIRPEYLDRVLTQLGIEWSTFGKIAELHREQIKRLREGKDAGRSIELYERAASALGLSVEEMRQLMRGTLPIETAVRRADPLIAQALNRLRRVEQLRGRLRATAKLYERQTGDRIHPALVEFLAETLLRRASVSDADLTRAIAVGHAGLARIRREIPEEPEERAPVSSSRPQSGPAVDQPATNRRKTKL